MTQGCSGPGASSRASFCGRCARHRRAARTSLFAIRRFERARNRHGDAAPHRVSAAGYQTHWCLLGGTGRTLVRCGMGHGTSSRFSTALPRSQARPQRPQSIYCTSPSPVKIHAHGSDPCAELPAHHLPRLGTRRAAPIASNTWFGHSWTLAARMCRSSIRGLHPHPLRPRCAVHTVPTCIRVWCYRRGRRYGTYVPARAPVRHPDAGPLASDSATGGLAMAAGIGSGRVCGGRVFLPVSETCARLWAFSCSRRVSCAGHWCRSETEPR
ncbi:hypothetical protein BC834DRAFT_496856 [Gloeopeniophorella convolvens]|nr:hypothetical protein BC834DRAFT_496856 [Gloeopeniophorella convolvens]